jgi:hypothetical protein
MTQRPDDHDAALSKVPQKSAWDRPEVARLFAGDAEGNPGDSHADGPSTFS